MKLTSQQVGIPYRFGYTGLEKAHRKSNQQSVKLAPLPLWEELVNPGTRLAICSHSHILGLTLADDRECRCKPGCLGQYQNGQRTQPGVPSPGWIPSFCPFVLLPDAAAKDGTILRNVSFVVDLTLPSIFLLDGEGQVLTSN